MRKHFDVLHRSSTGLVLRQTALAACLSVSIFASLPVAAQGISPQGISPTLFGGTQIGDQGLSPTPFTGSQLTSQGMSPTPVTTTTQPGSLTFSNTSGNGNMVVNADELIYDQDGSKTIARGKVQVFYEGRTIEADELIYFQKTKAVHAKGNVRVTERNGNIHYAKSFELDKGFRNGFIKAMQSETPDRLRLSSPHVTRQDGNVMIFDNATYTPAEKSELFPSLPPMWQIRAVRLIHNRKEKMLYMNHARLEFFGLPLVYLPYFSMPDPTVNKKTGFLTPTMMGGDRLGYGFQHSYLLNLGPNYDLTLTGAYYSQQGFQPRFDWRHALENGTYLITGSAISQSDPNAFAGTTGNRQFRGHIRTEGKFNITDRWIFGWDATLFSDTSYMMDYSLYLQGQSEANNTLYLQGSTASSWFDMRTTRYQGLLSADSREKLPLTHPQIEYFKTKEDPVLGGALSWRANITSLSRQEADFASRSSIDCSVAANINRANCLLQGVQGTYSRASVEMSWRKQVIDSFGQVWEPYFAMRGDVAAFSLANNLSNSTYLGSDDRSTFRAMPTAGLNYRYPWMASHSWGTSTIEPMVQLVVRPDEMSIGNLPNEDAQSLVFDDTNLFSWNKFSGYDRIEGGGRVNYALQYTAVLNSGMRFNVLFGQSLHLFGANSFTYGNLDTVSVGTNSGLDKQRSDYVGRFQVAPNNTMRLSARARFDSQTMAVQRGEIEASVLWGRLSTSAFASFIAPQPDLGYLTNRTGIGGAAALRVHNYWSIFGSARYAFERPTALGSNVSKYNQLDGVSFGVQYLDEAFLLSLFYSRDFVIGGVDVQRFMLRLNIRTLGEVGMAQTQNK